MRAIKRRRDASTTLAAGRGMKLAARVDLIRNFSPAQFTRALDSWDWIGIGDKHPVFTSPFGDVFLQSPDGFWFLDTLEATLSRRWASADELKAALGTAEGQDRFLLAGLAVSAERAGIAPTATQVYGFKIAPVLGGEIGVDNIEAIDFVVSINILGQLHRQVRDLPPGTQISRFTVDGGDGQGR
jgi:Domain of unknown function (DUF1851)